MRGNRVSHAALPRRAAGMAGVAALLGAAGCAGSQERADYDQAASGRRPDRILVQDFAVRPEEVTLDSSVRGRLTQAFSAESTDAQQLQAARQASAALSEALAEELRGSGLAVERSAPGVQAREPVGLARARPGVRCWWTGSCWRWTRATGRAGRWWGWGAA